MSEREQSSSVTRVQKARTKFLACLEDLYLWRAHILLVSSQMQSRTSWKLTGTLAAAAFAGCLALIITKGAQGFKTGDVIPFLYAGIALFFLLLYSASRTFRRSH
jgi:hypothetical protein